MDARATTGLLRYFQIASDGRGDNVSHSLANILSIAIMAVLCGVEGWAGVETWALAHVDWLKTFLDLPHGIPSHDTFGRVFGQLDPLKFEECFQAWAKQLSQGSNGLFVAVDGKTLRRSWKRAWSRTPVHLVSAFVAQNHLILGQLATDCKSNEITAIPKLLAMLDLAGSTVTIDAMGCQRHIASTIREKGGHYILAVKDNQPELFLNVRITMNDGIRERFKGKAHGYWEETEKGHGRIETRQVWVSTDVKPLGHDLLKAWPGLASLIVVESTRRGVREPKGKTSYERRYYISDHAHTDAKFFADGIRSHWGVESMHWSLDVAMNEDQSRVRMDAGAENLSRLRRIAINKLKSWQPRKPNGKPLKIGLKLRQQMCGWNPKYLFDVLSA
jgi:predicted transposase YbfD/YdcC